MTFKGYKKQFIKHWGKQESKTPEGKYYLSLVKTWLLNNDSIIDYDMWFEMEGQYIY